MLLALIALDRMSGQTQLDQRRHLIGSVSVSVYPYFIPKQSLENLYQTPVE